MSDGTLITIRRIDFDFADLRKSFCECLKSRRAYSVVVARRFTRALIGFSDRWVRREAKVSLSYRELSREIA